MAGDFGGFGDMGGFYGLPRPTSMGSNMGLAGARAGSETEAMLVDSRGRLVVVRSGPFYEDFFPAVISTTAGALYENVSGHDRILRGVRVLNVSAVAVSLKLYLLSNALEYSDFFVWGAPGVSIPSGGVWEWDGKWPVANGQELGGLAGVENSLYIHLDIQKGVDDLA